MTRKFVVPLVVTLRIPQTEIPALLESWVINTPFVKIFYSQKCLSLYFPVKKLFKCWSIEDL